MSATTNGKVGWMLGQPPDNEAERVLARVEFEYSGTVAKLASTIKVMQTRGDLNGLLLLQRFMVLGVNDISDHLKAHGAEPDQVRQ